MSPGSGIDQLSICREGVQRAFLILAHEAAVALDVGAENGGEFALHFDPLPVELPRHCCYQRP